MFMVQQICLGQLRGHLREYLDEVSAGSTLEVIRRGRLAALIVPESACPHAPPDATISVSGLRKNPARYFDRVAGGETIGVIGSGGPVARIMAATPDVARLGMASTHRRCTSA
jgi:antitoxin (DNA-binding transcriptional repressor) of toxin-antitoxin stability system